MVDFSKLFSAASLIEKSHPNLSEELIKVAQNLESNFAMQNGEDQNTGLNPNIESFAKPGQSPAQREVHKLTMQLDVPVGTDELDIMNNLLPILKQLEEKDYKLKGYAFDERTRG